VTGSCTVENKYCNCITYINNDEFKIILEERGNASLETICSEYYGGILEEC